MKSVLISIKPEWCDLIVQGEKTLEVRKTRPNLDTPFKCYIYCTRATKGWFWLDSPNIRRDGAVIGEFICDRINIRTPDCLIVKEDREKATEGSCLTAKEIRDYLRGNRVSYNLCDLPDFYGWHISGLKIYEKPKNLNDFRKPCENDLYCESCAMYRNNTGGCGNAAVRFTRPPQSWCYVEDN